MSLWSSVCPFEMEQGKSRAVHGACGEVLVGRQAHLEEHRVPW